MHCILNRSLRVLALSGVVVAAFVWSSAALAQNWFSPDPPASQGMALPPPAPDVGDLLTRIDRLEEVVRRLNSEVESLRRRLGEGTQASALATPQPAPAQPSTPQPLMQVSNEGQPQLPTEARSRVSAHEGASMPKRALAIGPPTPLLPLPPPAVVSSAVVSSALATPANSAARAPSARPSEPGQPSVLRGTQAGDEVEVSALPPGPASSQAEDAYSQAYGRLLAEDMDGAGAAFSAFLKRFPGHELSGNAQYWLAETHFARGQYTIAAREFLTGYKTYGSNPKAPESLLKLGLSLAALGRIEEACGSLREVAQRFPQAPSAVHERAVEEQANVGC